MFNSLFESLVLLDAQCTCLLGGKSFLGESDYHRNALTFPGCMKGSGVFRKGVEGIGGREVFWKSLFNATSADDCLCLPDSPPPLSVGIFTLGPQNVL